MATVFGLSIFNSWAQDWQRELYRRDILMHVYPVTWYFNPKCLVFTYTHLLLRNSYMFDLSDSSSWLQCILFMTRRLAERPLQERQCRDMHVHPVTQYFNLKCLVFTCLHFLLSDNYILDLIGNSSWCKHVSFTRRELAWNLTKNKTKQNKTTTTTTTTTTTKTTFSGQKMYRGVHKTQTLLPEWFIFNVMSAALCTQISPHPSQCNAVLHHTCKCIYRGKVKSEEHV